MVEWSIWTLIKDIGILLGGYLWRKKEEAIARWKSSLLGIDYEQALFLEYTTKSEPCSGITGDILKEGVRRKEQVKVIKKDVHNKAENILTDVWASFDVSVLCSGYIGCKIEAIEVKEETMPHLRLVNNIFSFGCGVPNPVSDAILKLNKIPVGFDIRDDEGCYPLKYPLRHPSEKLYIPIYDDVKKTWSLDYGILIRTKNPYNPKKKAVLLGGCHGYGTEAASKILTDTKLGNPILRDINEEFEDKDFILIFSCEIDEKKERLKR